VPIRDKQALLHADLESWKKSLKPTMSKEDFLIDSHVSHSQCQKAVEALHSHELKKKEKYEENQILPAREQHIWLNVTVKQVAPTHKVKPLKMYLFHCHDLRSSAEKKIL
jgi:hypothetical protein